MLTRRGYPTSGIDSVLVAGGTSSPGWYPDPQGSGRQRWWDGQRWTEHYQAPPAQPIPPAPVGLPASPAPAGIPGPPAVAPKQGMSGGTKALLWILAILGVLIVLGIGGCVACGAVLTKEVNNALEDKDYGTVGLRQPITVRGTTFEALSVRTADRVGGALGEKAGGKFVIVTIRISNKGDSPALVSSGDLQLEAKNGRRFQPDDAAQIASDAPVIFEDLKPRETRTGTVVYDVPPASIGGARMRVEALLGNGHAYINLGL